MSIPKIITIITLLLSILSCCSTRTTNRLQSQTDVEKSEQSEQYKTGKVIKVLDGDTFELLMEGNETVKVRMEGIDAPEGGMPYYRVAKNYLSDLCAGKEVTIEIKEKDHYGRYIALTYLEDGRELSHEMVRAV